MPKFHFHNHQGKSDRLIAALLAHKWEQTRTPINADVLFTDVDIQSHSKDLEVYHRRRKKIMIVPHAAIPNIFGDLPDHEPFRYTTVQFVPAQGHIDVMRAWGYQFPLEIMGWHMCDVKPFRPRFEIYNVLFAPVHPNADGSLSHLQLDANKAVFEKLLSLSEQGLIRLTVRYLQDLEKNGLWKVPNVRYVQGKADQTTKEIDAADVVIAKQTMQYLAVARGVPTVGFDEDVALPVGSLGRSNFAQVKSWERYKDIMAYPLDLLAVADTRALLESATRDDSMIADWRCRMIGEEFSPSEFVRKVEKYL